MVVPLGPGKFYGSSLPRPRIYTDVKLNPDRVDPPVPVTDALLYWAHEAHWSMGGHSFKRVHLQGRIEGNVNRLRKQKEKEIKNQISRSPVASNLDSKNKKGKKRDGSESPPPAPKAMKRRKLIDLFDEDSEEEVSEDEEVVVRGRRKMPARKLVGDFERVMKEKASDVVMKVVEEVNRENSESNKKSKTGKKIKNDVGESGFSSVVGKRTSPRLAKQKSS